MHVMVVFAGTQDETRTRIRTSNITWRPLAKCTFFVSFPQKRMDHESQKSGFRFDLMYLFRVWILWIFDRFFDFPQKKRPLRSAKISMVTPNKEWRDRVDWNVSLGSTAVKETDFFFFFFFLIFAFASVLSFIRLSQALVILEGILQE